MRMTFRGGVHPAEHKELSREQALREFPAKGELVYPVQQHIGKPAKPIVKDAGQQVLGSQTAAAAALQFLHQFISLAFRQQIQSAQPLSPALAHIPGNFKDHRPR